MVWGLFPLDSFPGAQEYYFFHRGTYKAGRKDCDVIIQNDKGVSRIHAELVVDAMTSKDPLPNLSSSFLSNVRIIDKSKYGTFINKAKGSKSVNEFPNKEITLKNGDLVSFGTGDAVFRFCFVPLIFFIHRESLQVDPSLQDIISSIGARITHDWDSSCTHMLAAESSSVSEDLIDVILAKKPVVRSDWLKVVADKSVRTEIPNFTDHIPNMTLEGISVKIMEPKDRENCLKGRTFVLGSSHMYKFGDRLKSLLELCSAKVLTVDGQTSVDGDGNALVLVISAAPVNDFNHFHQLNSLSRVNDMKLVAAVLTGHFDSSIIESAPITVSSQSTDETIVADSDVEMDTGTSDHIATARSGAMKHEEKEELLKNHGSGTSDVMKISRLNDEEGGIIERRLKDGKSITSENQNSDIIYSQDLIARKTDSSSLTRPTSKNSIVNFKCFRKRETPSGNSFKDLIPFSKYPYKESDCGSEVEEFMKREKQRKQMEAVAEDLFNSDRIKRRGAAGPSIRDLFARR